MMEGKALVLLALVAGVISGPISQEKGQCAKTCTETTHYDYETGKTYEFGYKADIVTVLAGATEEHSSLHIRATADVEVHAACDFALKLRDVRLEESDPSDLTRRTLAANSAEFARALERAPLSFAFQDGRVEALCAANDDPAWVLNIKRGVLSAFQNNMEQTESTHTVKETDIAGLCDAEYSVMEKNGESITVKRTKNLLGCTERTHHRTAIQGTPYNAESTVQSLPLMKSQHDCVQTIDGGVLRTAQCTEKHVFRPFSNGDAGASTSSVQKLEFRRRHRHHKRQGHHGSTRRTDLLFEHTEATDGQLVQRQRAEATLREICAHEDVRPQTTQLFSQLTYNLRELDTINLRELHRQVHTDSLCSRNHQMAKKFFLDAVPMVGTTASVSLIVSLIRNGHVTGAQADQWLTSLAFIAKPNADMIREIRPLFEATPKASMLLAASALTRTFCRTTGDCADNMDVRDMIRRLVDNLGTNCNANQDVVLMSLKALGNLGQGHVSVLTRCAAETANPIDIRVAAMAASRNMPCTENRREFLETFANNEEDAEVRINAYLAAMACPSHDVVRIVRRMLEKEEINQVGSFVWTHLTNLQETNDPFKQALKDIVKDETLQKEFDLDKRKFSRNYEGSMFFDSINAGAKVDSNIIWSSKSYVPRSGMLNLTVDLFGHSINLFEVGGRVEGVEHFIESLFGPNGYFEENAISSALKRSRRNADEEKFNRVTEKFRADAENEARGSVYMKMFGNELRYLNLDSTTMANPADGINWLEILLKLANNQEVDFTKSIMFLDSSVTVPTVVGLPLKLSVNGTASLKMAIGGKADMRQAATNPRSLEIDGYIQPSGAVEVSSVMSVDAFVSRTGLKMVSTLHTSTELRGQLSVQDSQVVLGKLAMPRDKVEIISVESKFFILHREAEREQQMQTEQRYSKAVCTGAGLRKTLGVELCGELEFARGSGMSSPYFPFTGPAGFKVFINKVDTHSSYDFEARLQTVRDRHSSPIRSQVARLSFNTPGSRVNRELFADVVLNHMDKTLNANLRTPWKKAVVNGVIDQGAARKRAALSMVIDDEHEYSINGDLRINQRPKKTLFTPVIEVNIPGVPTMALRGNVRVVPGEAANADLNLENIFRTPVTLKGGYDTEVRKNGLKRISSTLEVRTNSPVIKASGSVAQREGLMRTAVDVAYWLAGPRHRIQFNGLMKDMEHRRQYSLNLAGDMTSTQFPMLDHDIKINMKHTQGRQVQLDANLRYGSDKKTKTQRIDLSHESNVQTRGNAFNMDHTTKFTWKAMNIDIDSKVDHKHDSNEVKTLASITSQKTKKIDLDFHFRKPSASALTMIVDGTLSYPGNSIVIHEKLEEKTTGYAHEMAFQWHPTSRFTSNGELIISPNNKYDARLEINPPGVPSTVFVGSTSLNMDDFQAAASVEHAGRRIGVSTEYKNEMGRSTSGKLDIEYPSRYITVTSVLNRDPNAMSFDHDTTVMWDAKRDTTKKISLNGRFMNQNNRVEGEANVICPTRKYNVAFHHEKRNNKYTSHGEATWAPGQTVSLHTESTFIREGSDSFSMDSTVRFTSPIPKLEDIMMSVSGMNNHRTYNNRIVVSWKEGQQISSVLEVKKLSGWRNFESDLTISTPFVETINGALNLNTLDDQVTAHIEGVYSGQKMEFDITGKHSYPNLMEYSLSTRTPFRTVRRAGVSLGHRFSNGHLSTSASGYVNNKEAEVSVTGKLLTGRNMRDADFNIHLKTPFRSFEDMSARAKHTTNGNKFTNLLEASLGQGRTLSAAFDLIHETGRQHLINNGQLRISTPFQNAENIIATWTHNIRSSNVRINYEIGANSQSAKIDLTHTAANRGQLATRLQIETPFEAVRSLAVDAQKTQNGGITKGTFILSKNNAQLLNVDLDMKVARMNYDGKADINVAGRLFSTSASLKADASPFAGHVEFEWDKTNKVAVEGELSADANHARGNIRFVSPFQNFERLMLSVDHSMTGNKYINSLAFDYAENSKIQLDTTFTPAPAMDITIGLKTPCPHLKSATAQFNHNVRRAGFASQMRAAYASDFHNVNYDSSITANSGDDFNAQATLSASFMKDVTLNIVHKKVGDEWQSKTEFEYAPRQKVQIQTVVSIHPNIKFDLDMETPSRYLESLKTSLRHTGEGVRFQNDFNFDLLTSGEKTIFTTMANVYGLRRIISNMKLVHPGMQPLNLALNHHMERGNWHTDFNFGHSQKIDFDIQSDDKKVTIELKTPFAAVSNIKSVGEYEEMNGSSKSKFEIAAVSFGNMRKINGHYDTKETDFLDSHIALDAPEHTMSLIFKYKKVSNTWVSIAAVSHADVTIATELQYDPVAKEVSLSFNSPFRGFEDLHLQVIMRNDAETKYNKVQFTYANQKIMAEVRARGGNSKTLDIQVVSPFSYMRHMTANAGFSGASNDFKLNAEITHNQLSGKVSFEAIVKATIEDLDATISFTSPFTEFKNLKLKAGHKEQGPRRYISSLEAGYGSDKVIVLRSQLSLQSVQDLQGQITLMTPWSHVRSLQMAFNHNGGWRNMVTHIEAQLNENKKTEIDTSLQVADAILASVRAVTPIRSLENIEFNFSHNGPWYALRTTSDLKYNNQRIAASAELNANSGIQGSLRLTTPFTEDLTVTINHEGDFINFKHISEVQYANQKVILNGAASVNDNINVQFELNTPYREVRKAGIVVSHEGSLLSFNTAARLFMNDQHIDANAELRALRDINGKFTLKSTVQAIRDVTFEISHSGNVRAFTSKVLLTVQPEDPMTAEIQFTMTPDMTARVSINAVQKVDFSFEHKTSNNGYTQDGLLTYNDNNLIQLTNSFTSRPSIEGSYELKTSCDSLKDISFRFSHAGNRMASDSQATFTLNGISTRAAMTFNADPVNNLVLRFQSPIPHANDVTLSLSGAVDSRKIQGAMEFNSDDFKGIKTEGELHFAPDVTGRLAIETPFRYLEKHVATFSYVGSFPNVRAAAQLDLSHVGKMQLQGDLATAPSIAANLKLQTPFTNAKDYSFALKHEGPNNDFTTQVTVVSKEHFKMEGNANLKIGTENRGAISFSTDIPSVSGFSASFSHEGNMMQFRCHAEATCDDCGKVQIDADFASAPLNGEFKLQTPFTNMREYTISFSNEGPLDNFKTDLNVASREHFHANLKVNLKTSGSMAGGISFTSDIRSIKDFSLAFTHLSQTGQLRSHVEATCAGCGKIEANVDLTLTPTMRGEFIFKSPIKNMKMYTIKFNHDGDLSNFDSRIEVKSAEHFTMSANGELKTQNGLAGAFSFTSDVECLKDFSLAFDHVGNLQQFKSHAEFNCELSTVSLDADFHTLPSVVGNFRLSAPIIGLDNIRLNIKHSDDANSQKSSVEFTYAPGQVIKASTSLKTNPSVELNVQFDSPYCAEHEIQFTMNGNLRSFSSSGTHLRNKESIVSYEASFDSTSTIEASFRFDTTCPYIDALRVNFKGANQRNIFKDQLTVTYGANLFRMDVDMKARNGLDGTVKIASPWQPMKNVELNINHRRWRRRLQSDVTLKHNNDNYEGKINLKFKPDVEGELSLKTPFSQARHVVMTLSHQGDLMDLDQTLTLNHNGHEKFNGRLTFKYQPRIEGNVQVKTAYSSLRQFGVIFGHSGNVNQFNTHATVNHNGQQIGQAQIDIQTYPRMQADIQLQTPFSAARRVAATLNHDGSMRRFRSQASVDLNSQNIFNGELTFAAQPKFGGEMKIRTPGHNIITTLSHEGTLNQFTSKAVVSHNGQNKFDGQVVFATQPAIRVQMQLATPFTASHNIDATISHQGSLTQFTSTASISHNGEERFSSYLSFKGQPEVDVVYKVKTPFAILSDIVVTASHKGSLANFNTIAKAHYNGQRALDAELKVETSSVIKIYTKFDTPHTKLHEAGVTVKYQGDRRNFVVYASVQYKGEEMSTLVKYHLSGNTFESQLRIVTPFMEEAFNVIYNHEGTPQNFKCHAEVNQHKADLTFAMRGGEVAATLKSTVHAISDASVNVKYSADSINVELISNYGKFELDGNYKLKPLTVQVRLATPFAEVREITLDMSHRGNRRALYSSLNIKHNRASVMSFNMDFKNYARTVGHVELESTIPYMEKISAAFRHEMSSSGLYTKANGHYYNNAISTEVNIKFQPKISGSILLMTPFRGFKKTALKFNHVYEQDLVDSDATLTYGSKKTISIKGTFDRKPNSLDVSLNLNTPFNAVKSVGAEFKQEGNWKNLKSTAQGNLNAQVIKVDSIYREQNAMPVEAFVKLYTPFTNWEETSIEMSDAPEGTRHQPRLVATWNRQQVQLAGSYNLRSSQDFDGQLTLSTPFRLLNEMTMSGGFKKARASVETNVQLTYNGNKVLDAQNHYRVSGNKQMVTFSMAEPHPMSIDVEFVGEPADFTAKTTLHWDTRREDKKVGVELRHKLEGAKRTVGLRFITAIRTTGINVELERSAVRFAHKLEVIWDEAKDKKASYEVDILSRQSRYHRIFESRIRLDTPIRAVESTLKHRDDSQKYETELVAKWDAARDASRMVTLRNTYENIRNTHKHQLVISHPRMAKDIVLRNQWTMNIDDIIYSGRTEIEYTGDSSDTLVMSTLVQDHSGNYSVELGLSHPQSKLDVRMNSHMANTASSFSAGMDINYMTARRKVTNMSLRGEIEKIRKQLNVELLTPVKKLQLNGKMRDQENGYSVNVVATEDEENQVSARLNLDTEAQTVDMKAYYSPRKPNNMLHMYGKYIDGKSLVVEAKRHSDGRETLEGHMSMNLKDQHLLNTKVYWRPDAYEEAMFAAKKAKKLARQEIGSISRIVSKAFTKEIRAKRDAIRTALPSTAPISSYFAEEARSFYQDYRVTKRVTLSMFNSNEFYMRTLYRASARHLEALRATYTKVKEAVGAYAAAANQAIVKFSVEVSRFVTETCTEMWNTVVARASTMANAAMVAAREAVKKYEKYYDMAVEKYIALREEALLVIEKYVEIALHKASLLATRAWDIVSSATVMVQEYIDDVIATLMSNPRVQQVLAWYNTFITKANEFMVSAAEKLSRINVAAINHAHEVVRSHLETMVEFLDRLASNFLQTAAQYLSRTQTVCREYIEAAIRHENSERVRQLMERAYNEMSAAFVQLDVPSRTKAFVRDVVLGAVNFVKRNSYYLLDEYLHLEENRIIEWSPASGHLEVQAHIPMEVPRLQTVSFVDMTATYQRATRAVTALLPDMDYSVWDTYYKFKPSSDISEWLPPFKAHATLAGRQHYITFDGKHYDFASPCSYLLARDFVDGNFSMTVNYDGLSSGVSKRSVIVASAGKEIEIFTDGRVTIDGQNAELPSQWATTTVSVNEDILTVTDKKGFTVECDLAYDSCTLNVAGWYFGKLAGLFGTYNNEQADDLTTAEGNKVTSISQFASSWAVGRRCARSRNMARTSATDAARQECTRLFSRESTLRPCYRIVNPEPFKAICANQVSQPEGASCNAGALYVAECRRSEVDVTLPTQCQRQDNNDEFMTDLQEYMEQ